MCDKFVTVRSREDERGLTFKIDNEIHSTIYATTNALADVGF